MKKSLSIRQVNRLYHSTNIRFGENHYPAVTHRSNYGVKLIIYNL
jgi:hypothetical protein